MCLGGGDGVTGVCVCWGGVEIWDSLGYTSQSSVGGEISREIIGAALTSFHPKLGPASSTRTFEQKDPAAVRPHRSARVCGIGGEKRRNS